MKKGFTLVELIGVIIILVLLSLLAIPPILNSINSTKSELSEVARQLVINASELYLHDDKMKYPDVEGNTYCITVGNLIDEEYLTSPVLDPITKKEISRDKYIKSSIHAGIYDYEFVDACQEVRHADLISRRVDIAAINSWFFKSYNADILFNISDKIMTMNCYIEGIDENNTNIVKTDIIYRKEDLVNELLSRTNPGDYTLTCNAVDETGAIDSDSVRIIKEPPYLITGESNVKTIGMGPYVNSDFSETVSITNNSSKTMKSYVKPNFSIGGNLYITNTRLALNEIPLIDSIETVNNANILLGNIAASSKMDLVYNLSTSKIDDINTLYNGCTVLKYEINYLAESTSGGGGGGGVSNRIDDANELKWMTYPKPMAFTAIATKTYYLIYRGLNKTYDDCIKYMP